MTECLGKLGLIALQSDELSESVESLSSGKLLASKELFAGRTQPTTTLYAFHSDDLLFQSGRRAPLLIPQEQEQGFKITALVTAGNFLAFLKYEYEVRQ